MMKLPTIFVNVSVQDGKIRYLKRENGENIETYDTYFIGKNTTVAEIASYSIALFEKKKELNPETLEIVCLENDDETYVLALTLTQ